jgi:hypothetical protein
MLRFKENEIKYLAGLLDADGSLFFSFVKYKEDMYNVRLNLVLQQSESIDMNGSLIKYLSGVMGDYLHIELHNKDWSDANRWYITSLKELNMLIPRVVKHMVIKAKHWKRLLDKYNNLYGKTVSFEEMMKLKEFSKESRKDTGPLKPKKHPTWAWVAGYLDGDGCYYMRTRKKWKGIWKELQVSVVSKNEDDIGILFLKHAFSGRISQTKESYKTYTRSLGIKDSSFAISFLRKMYQHSKLKKHKISLMLNYHLQRLNEKTPAGDVIV